MGSPLNMLHASNAEDTEVHVERTTLIIVCGHSQVDLFQLGDLSADGTIELESLSCNLHVSVSIWICQMQIKTGIFLSKGGVLSSWLWIHIDTWFNAF